MVHHNRRAGKGAGKVEQIGKLRVIHEGVEAEAERRQLGEPFAYLAVAQPALGPDGRRAPMTQVRMARRDEADAAEAAATQPDHRLKDLAHTRALREVGVADDAGADA